MASLFDLKGEYLQLMEWMNDPDIDPDALAETLESVRMEIEDKAEGYIKVIENFKSDAEAYSKQAKIFKEKADRAEKNATRLTEVLKSAMEETGHKELKTELFNIKIVGNGGKQPLKIIGDVPEQYIKMVPQNDTEAIRKYLESLATPDACPWAKLEERGTRLSIK